MRRPARLESEARDRDRAVTLVATWELDDVERETFRVPERETTTRASAGPGVEPVILFGGLRNVLEQYEHGSTWGKVDFFPCSRQLPRRPVGRMPKMRTELQESLLRLSATADKYDGLWGWLDEELSRTMRLRDEEVRSRGVVFADDVVESLAWLRDSFGSFPCATRFRGVSATEGGLEFETERGAVLATEALSGSARQALLFSLAFKRVLHCRSVLLIDTPELSQHPTTHAAVLRALVKLGGKSQIIAATTSREILESGAAEVVLELP